MKQKNISMIIFVYFLASYVIRWFLSDGSSFRMVIVISVPLIVSSACLIYLIRNKKEIELIIIILSSLIGVSILAFVILSDIFFPNYVTTSVLFDYLLFTSIGILLITSIVALIYFLNKQNSKN